MTSFRRNNDGIITEFIFFKQQLNTIEHILTPRVSNVFSGVNVLANCY